MTGQFDLRLTNQRKGAFHSRPRVEIEFSSCLLILLPQNEKRKIKLNSCFSFFGKNEKSKKELFSHFSTFNIKSKND